MTMNLDPNFAARPFHLSARRIAVLAAILALTVAAAACSSEPVDDGRITIVEGLTSPRGLILDEDGNLLIAETGGGRLHKVTPEGDVLPFAESLPYALNSGPNAAYRAGPSAISIVDGEIFVLVGEFLGSKSSRLYRITDDAGYEAVTPAIDALSPFGNRFSNPYDIVDAPEVDGWIVSDGGANSLLAVDRDGNVRDYFVFENFEHEDHNAPIEVVPTGIARGADGAVYVGVLTGFPYPDEAATVWRVEDMNADGDAMDEGEVEPYVTGLTAITDIIFGPDGTLYIAEFSTDTRKVFEGGNFAENAISIPGRILSWDGSELEVIADKAVSPTGLLATESTLYVSEEYAGRVFRLPLN